MATVQNKGTETEQTVSVFFCALLLFVAHNANAGLHRKRQKAHRVSDSDAFRPVLVQADACLPESRTDLKSQRRPHSDIAGIRAANYLKLAHPTQRQSLAKPKKRLRKH
ncbi:hypothetical protein ACFQ2U_15680 [Undibacterium aquatile]